LPGDPAFLCDRFGRRHDAACDQTGPAFVLAREPENRVAFGDVLPAIHRLLRTERERLRRRISNLAFDRERHFCPPLTNSRYSSQNAETFFRPELRRITKSSAKVSGWSRSFFSRSARNRRVDAESANRLSKPAARATIPRTRSSCNRLSKSGESATIRSALMNQPPGTRSLTTWLSTVSLSGRLRW